jgi:hypothetical protein
MTDLDYLRKWASLATRDFPVTLIARDEIEAARRWKAAGVVDVAIPLPLKGRYNYGEQNPAILKRVTIAGRAR